MIAGNQRKISSPSSSPPPIPARPNSPRSAEEPEQTPIDGTKQVQVRCLLTLLSDGFVPQEHRFSRAYEIFPDLDLVTNHMTARAVPFILPSYWLVVALCTGLHSREERPAI